jgi:hypothetical protein
MLPNCDVQQSPNYPMGPPSLVAAPTRLEKETSPKSRIRTISAARFQPQSQNGNVYDTEGRRGFPTKLYVTFACSGSGE